jgi:hypothetical protein
MVELQPDDAAAALLEPVLPVLTRGLALLPDAPPLRVRAALSPGSAFYDLSGDEVALSSELFGSELHHPAEPSAPLPPLDRWRRAAASVLEAASLRELSRRTGLPPDPGDWRWAGAAIWAAHSIAPDIQLGDPDLALAVETGSPGEHPRAGFAVMCAWASEGVDPIKRARYLLEGGVISAPEWSRVGRWALSAEGGLAALPIPVARVPDADVPLTLPAWSWRPLRIGAHRRGGFVRLKGDGVVDEPWAAAGAELRTLAAAASTPCELAPEPGGPLGDWDVASAEGFGQIMGARGIRFGFRADGRLELVLADAFVGPLAAVAMAEQVGTSGVCSGAWRVDGPRRLRFAEIETASLTLHGRSRDRFLLPAGAFGLAEWLAAMQEHAWSWQVVTRPGERERLVMRGRMMGGEVEIRLRRA